MLCDLMIEGNVKLQSATKLVETLPTEDTGNDSFSVFKEK